MSDGDVWGEDRALAVLAHNGSSPETPGPMLDERKKRFAIPEGLMAGSGGGGRSIDRDWRALVGLEAACGFVVLRL